MPYANTVQIQPYNVNPTASYTFGNITTGNIAANVDGYQLGYRNIPQISLSTTNASVANVAAGKHYFSTSSTMTVLTIENNSTISWEIGSTVVIVNQGTGTISVERAAGVNLYLAGYSTSANRSIGSYGVAVLINVGVNTWFISGTGVT